MQLNPQSPENMERSKNLSPRPSLDKNPLKPLGQKAYGSIAHLPDSRRGPKDIGLSAGQARICCDKKRDKHDTIIVQEKLDGSNVAIAKLNGEIIPLIRSGYRAISSKYEMHRHFHNWVYKNLNKFEELLQEGERCVGEWLLQAHGTRYNLPHPPFVIFDLMQNHTRSPWQEVEQRVLPLNLTIVNTIHKGEPLSIPKALKLLGQGRHGALDPIEGVIWRVERHQKVDFLAKYVKPDKIDGIYLPEISKSDAVFNQYKED